MKAGFTAESSWMLAAESRLLPLARLLHYAKQEALELGLRETADTLEQALSALLCQSASAAGGSSATH
jgi:hypothetical protein